MEEGYISITRQHERFILPSKFLLISASNPCPCGTWMSTEGKKCKCTEMEIHKYINNELDKKKILYLCGMLNFAISIEPEFVQRMQNKYGKEVIMDIRKYQ